MKKAVSNASIFLPFGRIWANKMTPRESFEEWWLRRGHLYPPTMKEAVWIAFVDSWYRAIKSEKIRA
jgi:hypothetical protein